MIDHKSRPVCGREIPRWSSPTAPSNAVDVQLSGCAQCPRWQTVFMGSLGGNNVAEDYTAGACLWCLGHASSSLFLQLHPPDAGHDLGQIRQESGR